MEHPFITYEPLSFSTDESLIRSKEFYALMNKRRSVRFFSDKDVPEEIIRHIINTAGTAPSGAHKQPWVFCVIRNKDLKHQIRMLAEEEEKENYESRMSERWLKDLAPLGTNDVKEFIDIAPWIIVVMKKSYDFDESGTKTNNYYVSESVGIACGFLIAAIHQAGLVTLTHTPSPMNFLVKALKRPENEKPFLLLPVGYPANQCKVPDLKRKTHDEIAIYFR
ncbi:MAG: nitroreductase family protein [Crocinitomicaceae bacterium]|nr:nitroreductase family protein [Crocinitomicaceae bacterium]MBK8927806.1 nitroreductase family protein [Crocinitomicaceae bacterium]